LVRLALSFAICLLSIALRSLRCAALSVLSDSRCRCTRMQRWGPEDVAEVHVVSVFVGVGGLARPATLVPFEWFVTASADVGSVVKIASGSAIRTAAAAVSARSASFGFCRIT
jgi:hypothetical protein